MRRYMKYETSLVFDSAGGFFIVEATHYTTTTGYSTHIVLKFRTSGLMRLRDDNRRGIG